jgi:hypothetical protein
MNIIDALILAKQGGFVKRKDWGDDVLTYSHERGFYFYNIFHKKYANRYSTLHPEDYNANDWEIVNQDKTS